MYVHCLEKCSLDLPSNLSLTEEIQLYGFNHESEQECQNVQFERSVPLNVLLRLRSSISFLFAGAMVCHLQNKMTKKWCCLLNVSRTA